MKVCDNCQKLAEDVDLWKTKYKEVNKQTEELKELIKAYQRTYKTEHRLLCETVQKRDDYKHQLQTLKNKKIEKLRKEIMISGGDALMKIQEKVGLKHQLQTQRDDIFKEIKTEIKRAKGTTDDMKVNVYLQQLIYFIDKIKMLEHLKQTHKEQ